MSVRETDGVAIRYCGEPAEPVPLGFRPSFSVNFGFGAGGGGIARLLSSAEEVLKPLNGLTLATTLSSLTAGIEIGGSGAGP